MAETLNYLKNKISFKEFMDKISPNLLYMILLGPDFPERKMLKVFEDLINEMKEVL
jgi:hypothetical protein